MNENVFSFENECCGEVYVPALVLLLTEQDFSQVYCDDRLISAAAESYRHLMKNKCGCFHRFGTYLEEIAMGNSRFNHKRWKDNINYLHKHYPIS